MAETLPLVPFSTQVGTMVRLRLRLYARNPKLVLVGLASPLISIGMAIGLSALFSSMLPKMTLGDSIDGLPLLPLQAAGFDDVHPGTGPLLAGGGADPASVAIMQSVVSSFFTQSRGASAKSVVWQSPADMNAFIAQEQRRIDAPKSIDPQDWAPTSGFLVHAPGAGSPTSPFVDPSAVNLSLIVNGEAPSTSRSLGRAPLIMTNLVHNALQPILTFTPLDALNGGAGQDPRTRPTGSNAPTGAAARASIDALIAKYRTALAASRANGGSNPPTAPWAMFLKGSMSSFPIQASDIFDLSAQIVPPFVSFGLTMLMLLFTEELVRERADGIFDYLVTNTLSPAAYLAGYAVTAYMFLLIPIVAACVGLSVVSTWFANSNIPGLVVLIVLYGFVVVVGSGIISFFFRNKASVGPALSLFITLTVFLPYFIVDVILKVETPVYMVCAMGAVLPAFGFYRTLGTLAVASSQGTPINSIDFTNPLLPMCLIFIGQLIVGSALVLYLARNTLSDGDPTQAAPIWALFTKRAEKKVLKVSATDAATETGLEAHPNAAIPLDPQLLRDKGRLHAIMGQNLPLRDADAVSAAMASAQTLERTAALNQADDDEVVRVCGLGMHFAVTPGSTAAGAAGKPEERKWWQGAPKPIRRKVLDDLYFSVRRNEAFAYLGPNGSGKSTTINILTGLLRPSEGCATVCGYPVTTANYDPAIKRLIGVCQQADMVFETLTVREHLEYFAAIKGVADIPSAVTTALSDMALEPVANVHSKALSGGNRRRLSIALACLGRPQVVILDEPTTGVDVATRRTIWTSILALKKHTSVILVTHSLDEADALCDRVGIMINGSLVCLGTPQRLKNLYGASYKVVLRTATPAGGAMAARALQDQFPTATKIDSQVGCNLDLEVDLAKLEVDLGMSQHQPPRGSSLPKGAGHAARLQLADGRVVLADADVANRNSVTAAFLGAVFEAVATRGRTEWGVKDWSVAQTSLSEVFVRLARYHKSHLEEERAAAAGWEEN